MGSPWREPRVESDDLYPGLSVNDGRVSGSIVVGPTRLPLWAFIGEAVLRGWDSVEEGYQPGEYGFTDRDLAKFLYDLLEARGEFGRLLLVIANAHRQEVERESRRSEDHFAKVHPGGHICDCGEPMSPAWWDDPEFKAPVVDQLRRCLAALEDE